MKRKIIALLLTAILLFGVLGACSDNSSSASPSEEPTVVSPTTKPTEGEGSDELDEDEFNYPIVDEPYTLSYFFTYSKPTNQVDPNEGTIWIEQEKRTGVHIDWLIPPANEGNVQFNLLIASGSLPDLLGLSPTTINNTGGLDRYIDDEFFYDLSSDMETYSPNYYRWINSSEDYRKICTTDAGRLAAYWVLLEDLQKSYFGPLVRQDMLDSIGYQGLPTTLDDWTDMLIQLKSVAEKAPYYCTSTAGAETIVLCAFGFSQTYWQLNSEGKVTFAPMEPAFREYLQLMSHWRANGLTDPSWATNASALRIDYARILNNDFSVFGSFFTLIDTFEDQSEVEGYTLTPVKPPVKNEGDIRGIHILQVSASPVKMNYTVISSEVSDLEIAMRWLDYWYTDEGILLAGYGIEGETFYYRDDGTPALTALVANNETMSMSETQAWYLGTAEMPTVHQWRREWTDWTPQKAIDACNTWDTDYVNTLTYPVGAAMTAEESQTYTAIYGDIQTYVAEEVAHLITDYSDEAFDAFQKQLKEMDVDICIEMHQNALDRYLAR